ncbi:hypothetical protein [Sphingopyxis sp.]|uniref:hypothetical protein n=1 Tax=Sphingopyxis sp. TaxID=1908224 RepID=UPI001D88CBC2|nr:hypothetical protein [Sphingopyxis sp.]MBW8294949.1 hypothetical protein [Sphingopyxis sp.]
MSDGRCWTALVTFERGEASQDILPEEARGACGWMGAVAPDEDTTCTQLVMDLELLEVRDLEISDLQEVFEIDEFKNLDDHLAENFQVVELGKMTVWGSIHCYIGDGQV